MTTVRRAIDVSASLVEVEALWYATDRWASWVDGFGRVIELREPWPHAGGEVVWQSNPYGRGRVTERVTSQTPGQGQTAEVEDDRMTAGQAVSFAPSAGAVTVSLAFDYQIKRARPWMFLVDVLFIRRAVGDSLGRTLEGFARELGQTPPGEPQGG